MHHGRSLRSNLQKAADKGVLIAPASKTGKDANPFYADFKLTATELAYANQPSAKTCEITGLFLSPKIEAVDSAGRTLTAETEPDPNAARQEFVFPHADEPNPDEVLLDRIDKLTHTYMDYVINTHCTVEANLAALSNYMLPGSDFANLMNHISGDVWYNNDPNMREDHVIEVQHLVKAFGTFRAVDDISFSICANIPIISAPRMCISNRRSARSRSMTISSRSALSSSITATAGIAPASSCSRSKLNDRPPVSRSAAVFSAPVIKEDYYADH